ncbi:MAG: leucine-rich repeat domain-containing protein [Spirochaetaceae bacterium]|jgi:hypothetical protein|nr:leucine-rich repeat domain-containing protein [Spirochaetaceae bacterium]
MRGLGTFKYIFLYVAIGLLCGICAGVWADNPSLVIEELDYAVSASVDLSGNKYIGYAGQLPSVMSFVNDDGTVSVSTADTKAQKTYVYEYGSDMKLLRTLQFQNEFSLLGAFTKDSEGNYYFFYASPSGKSAENMAAVKYDKDGKKLLTYKLNAHAANSMDGVKQPFDAGTCRLELSGSLLAVYFARLMFNGHQASYGFVLDKDTFERADNGATTNDKEAARKIMPYVSHSFNQFIVPVDDGFVFADHGDAYPRAFAFARWQTKDRTKRTTAFKFTGGTGQNATYAEMGGLAKTQAGFLFAGTYGKSAAGSRNVFVLGVAGDMSSCGDPVYLTSYTKNDGHAAHPKITALDGNRYLLMWELCEYSTQSANAVVSDMTGYKSAYMMIIDETGKPLTETKQLPAGVRLNMNDVLRYNKTTGNVHWAVSAGGKVFGVWSFNPDQSIDAKIDVLVFDKPAIAEPEHFKYTVKGKQGENQTITITKYAGPVNNLIIPEQINGIPVTVIGKNAFAQSSVTMVVLPAGLKVIEDQAFWYSNITALVIPEGVESIGKQSFSFCKSLVTVTLPKSMRAVKEFAFMDCPQLTTVTIPEDSDMALGYGAFDKCPKLDERSRRVISSF